MQTTQDGTNYAGMLKEALDGLRIRSLTVGERLNWYEGRHPLTLGGESWNKSFRRLVAGIIDNQCHPVIEHRAEAVMPADIKVETGDKVEEAYAGIVADVFTERSAIIAEATRHAEASGEQTTIAVDYDADGEVALYLLDSRSCYVKIDRAGAYLWAVHLWADDAGLTAATVYLPDRTTHLTTTVKVQLPEPIDFRVVEEIPNPFGELLLGTVDKHGSVIDRVAPLNMKLNKSLQSQYVAGEAYMLPLRVWLGIETYDPDTGESTNILPTMNPATASRDFIVPTSQDGEGGDRSVQQFEAPDPSKYESEQDNMRLAIARQASMPAFTLQVGAAPASGDALEIVSMPDRDKKKADERVYRPFLNRVARAVLARQLFKETGRATPLRDLAKLEVVFSQAATTEASRMEKLKTARDSGVPLEDALVEFYGMSREAAEVIAGNAAAEATAAADRALQAADAGVFLD